MPEELLGLQGKELLEALESNYGHLLDPGGSYMARDKRKEAGRAWATSGRKSQWGIVGRV